MNLSEQLARGAETLDDRMSSEKRLFLVTLYLGSRAIDARQDGGEEQAHAIRKTLKKLVPDLAGQLESSFQDIDFRKITASQLKDGFYKQAIRLRSLSVTPLEINRLIAGMLHEEQVKTIYDGACGFGGSFLDLAVDHPDTAYYGQDVSPEAVALTDMFLTLSGNTHQVARGDAILDPAFFEGTALKKFDAVVIDPPIGMKTAADPQTASHGRFSPLDRKMGKLDFYFLLNAVERSKGKTIIVSGSGPLIRSVASEQKVRRYLLAQLSAVIRLPAGLYPASATATNLLLFDHHKENDHVLMIDAGSFSEGRLRDKKISEDGIQKILSVLKTPKNEDGFSRLVPDQEIVAHDDSWDVDKYLMRTTFLSKHLGEIRWNQDTLRALKTVPLQDLCTLVKGYNLSANNPETGEGAAVLRLNDISDDGRIDFQSIARFAVNRDLSRHRLRHGDIVLVAKGTRQKIAVFDSSETVYLSINLMALRPKQINPYFFKAYLESPLGEYYLSRSQSGTILPVLTAKSLSRLPVPEELITKADQIGESCRRLRSSYYKKLTELQKKYVSERNQLDDAMNQGIWDKA
ncbi:N-6 DNA methylase [Sporolactobacillus sp. Y61]|uniref:site-specific DNA-methyltransferase (adenine-specific) n=1 Tax=Sporolactobacillus sp. Y61 TaxID=3160863 RepID=A0AAU8IGL1_9BACL